MKRFFLLFSLIAGTAGAQTTGACYTSGIYKRVTITFTTADTSKTILTAPRGQDIHVCTIKFVLPEAHVVTLQGSDSSTLDGPDPIQGASAYFATWGGQIDTTTLTLTPSTAIGIKLTLDAVPSVNFGVTMIYYLVQR